LSWVMKNPERPFVSVIGGIKIGDKIKLLEKLLQTSDFVLVGGKIANTILVVKGICVRDSWTEDELKLRNSLQFLNIANPKLQLPVDGIISLSSLEENYLRIGAVGTLRKEEDILILARKLLKSLK